jgi:hypothetical protein
MGGGQTSSFEPLPSFDATPEWRRSSDPVIDGSVFFVARLPFSRLSSVDDEGPHRGRRMLPAGPRCRTRAERCDHRPASLGGQDEAAHRAMEADQRRPLDVHPHHRIPGYTVGRCTDTTVRGGRSRDAGALTAAAGGMSPTEALIVMHLTVIVDALSSTHEQGVIP